MDVRTEKQRLRSAIAERLSKLTAKDREAESRSVCRRIEKALPENIRTIATYYPMKTEPDVRPFIESAMQKGVAIFMPRAEGKAFAFRRVTSFANLVPGPFGILEPTVDEEELNLANTDLALVPGVAFDPAGNRMGRGNGGYDAWLDRLKKANGKALAWGLAFDCQIVHEVPTEPHDRPMDKVITARS